VRRHLHGEKNMQKILIADDHPVIQSGVAFLLKDHIPNVEIEAAYNGNQIFAALKKEIYHLLILDISMPNMSFSDFEQILDSYPKQKILIFTQHLDEQYALRYMKRGATGFLNKSQSDETLISAVKLILNGHKYFSPAVMDLLIDNNMASNFKQPLNSLSSREYEIVVLISKGFSLTDIAEEIHLSLSAVSTYKNRAMQKLQVRNLVELIELTNQFLR